MTKRGERQTPLDRSKSSPLADWSNDDPLVAEEARKIVAMAAPRALRVLDWPRLRREFQYHEKIANDSKKRVNRSGLTGAFMSAIGTSILAFSPLIPNRAIQNSAVILGCCLVLIGCLVGLWHFLGHSGKAKWLLGRIWTERLRQFYFQYLINNFDSAIAAMRDDAALASFCSLRDGALAAYIDDLNKNLSARSFADAIEWLSDDHDDTRVWGETVWATCRISATEVTSDHIELFRCLSQRRIGIQEIYAQSNLKSNSRSQSNMARRIGIQGNIATLIFVLSLTLTGVLIVFGGEHVRIASDGLIAVSGISAAWGLYLRLVDQGMGYSLDVERYELYAEQINLVRQRFDDASDDVRAKIAALRQLEVYSYRELRQFLRTHFRSRFLG